MRIALSGYYGFGNLGDEALLAGTIQELRRRGHVPVVLSADPASTRRLHDVEARSRTWGVPAALASADALVSGGGGLLQDGTSARSLAYYLAVIRLARVLGKPAAVYGQSIGPLSPRGRRWVRYALRGLPVAVRDRPSEQILTELGIAHQRTADPALLVSAEAPTPAAGVPDRPYLLVPRAGYPEHTAALAAVAMNLSEAGDAVQALALHPGADAEEARRVQAACGDGPPTIPVDHRDAVERIRSARGVLSTRLHGLIFAAATGVPHAGLVYDPKVSGFLEDSGGRAFRAPFDVDAMVRTLRHPDTAGASERRERLLARATAGFDWLDDVLTRRT